MFQLGCNIQSSLHIERVEIQHTHIHLTRNRSAVSCRQRSCPVQPAVDLPNTPNEESECHVPHLKMGSKKTRNTRAPWWTRLKFMTRIVFVLLVIELRAALVW